MRYIHLQVAFYSKGEAYYLGDYTELHQKGSNSDWHFLGHEHSKKFFKKYGLDRHSNGCALNSREYILSKSDSEVTFLSPETTVS